MLKISTLTLRNFLSVGNATQAIRFDQHDLTLIIGHNLDAPGSQVRNGAGKTTILQAISYALFGKPLTKIKADNLVNNINTKQMLVTIEFERDGRRFKIERGRKPALLRYWVNESLVSDPEDEAQGDSRNTQRDIEVVLGFSHMMFKHIVALNTFTDPFLKMSAAEQRATIEELLGITQVSQKAEQLKELVKGTKDAIREEELRIKTMLEANQKIQNTIADLELKSRAWNDQRQRAIKTAENQLEALRTLDIEAEIAAHAERVAYREAYGKLAAERRSLKMLVGDAKRLPAIELRLERLDHELTHFDNNICPTCEQPIASDHGGRQKLQLDRDALVEEYELVKRAFDSDTGRLHDCEVAMAALGDEPATYYDDPRKAYEHQATLDAIVAKLAKQRAEIDPYLDQIDTLRHEGLAPISYDYVNELNVLLKHQEFLLKLLTSKDSFIRKKIIDQNLSYLNHRLNHYLEKLGLPHEVRFKPDLTVEITLLGRDFDFEQLSRGEMNRVILANSFSFRDVWESLNQTLNILFVDEMIDSGMDQHGSESALEVLKHLARERSKNVLLISHKDELVSRVSRILLVRKENSFTQFDDNVDSIE
jgi:DNA repair exonuclease SbcCD ATPase subunit